MTTRSVRDRDAGGAREIRAALGESRRLVVSVGLFSAFVNLLMLTGPLFMLQVYDRVLTSRSEATLVALAGIVAFLFLMMGRTHSGANRIPENNGYPGTVPFRGESLPTDAERGGCVFVYGCCRETPLIRVLDKP